MAELEELLRSKKEAFAAPLHDSIMAGWIGGARSSLVHVPDVPVIPSFGFPPNEPPSPLAGTGEPEDLPEIELPGLDEAIRKLLAKKVVSPGEFYAVSASARDQAFTVSGDLIEDSIEKIRGLLVENLEGPASRQEFLRAVRDRIETLPISDAHLEMVYRNNTNAAYAQGINHVLDNPLVVDAFPYRAYFAIHDDRARHEHIEMESLGIDGTNIYHKDDPTWQRFEPPWSWNCILPQQSVQGVFSAGFRSWYDGECVEFTTRKGNRLAVTINHPVLTSFGLRPAGTLQEGENLLSYSSEVQSFNEPNRGKELSIAAARTLKPLLASPSLNKQRPPTTIEEVFRAIGEKGAFVRMRTASDDFHGDAANGNGYVDVVTTDRELLVNIEARSNERFGDFQFVTADPLATAGGHLRQGRFACRSSASSLPGAAALPLDGSAALLDGPPLHSLRFGPAANLDATIYEPPTDNAAIDAERICQRLLGCSSQIAFDEIINVKRYHYVGPVYDLRADGGWILAENLFVSNCRCGFAPISVRDAAKLGAKEAQEWLDSGVEPAHVWVKPPPFAPDPSWDRGVLV